MTKSKMNNNLQEKIRKALNEKTKSQLTTNQELSDEKHETSFFSKLEKKLIEKYKTQNQNPQPAGYFKYKLNQIFKFIKMRKTLIGRLSFAAILLFAAGNLYFYLQPGTEKVTPWDVIANAEEYYQNEFDKIFQNSDINPQEVVLYQKEKQVNYNIDPNGELIEPYTIINEYYTDYFGNHLSISNIDDYQNINLSLFDDQNRILDYTNEEIGMYSDPETLEKDFDFDRQFDLLYNKITCIESSETEDAKYTLYIDISKKDPSNYTIGGITEPNLENLSEEEKAFNDDIEKYNYLQSLTMNLAKQGPQKKNFEDPEIQELFKELKESESFDYMISEKDGKKYHVLSFEIYDPVFANNSLELESYFNFDNFSLEKIVHLGNSFRDETIFVESKYLTDLNREELFNPETYNLVQIPSLEVGDPTYDDFEDGCYDEKIKLSEKEETELKSKLPKEFEKDKAEMLKDMQNF